MADKETYDEIKAPPPTEFHKNLRCCITCRLVKTLDQFFEGGCDNCTFLEMENDRERIEDCTTTEFKGMAAVIDPSTSWVSKWLHHRKHAPGVYALSVNADVPQYIHDILDNNGITLRQDD